MGCTQSYSVVQQDNICRKGDTNGDLKLQESPGDGTFSIEDKKIIRETWKQISMDRQEKGIAIFVQIFSECPQAQKLFPFKDCNGYELLQNSKFRSHALRFLNAVDTTVQGLDAPDVALVPVLHHLGKIHGWIPGFLHEYQCS